MGIKGFQGTSLLDFPGRIASLVFTGGCNLTCPFCHNPSLVLTPDDHPDYPPQVLLRELEERRNFIDGVVISGGEPTLDPELPAFVRQVKALGLLVKLDTNGLAPEMLQGLLAENLLDYVALDVKTAPGRYGELHRSPIDLDLLPQSVELLRNGSCDYEFRTTCVPGFVEGSDMHAMGDLVRGGKRWILQRFVPEHSLALALRKLSAHAPSRMHEFATIAGHYVPQVHLRGME
ncbi:anaerobic ribonucleoside-triphosphate reductase activating protein [Geoalkalibacter halelectricus]|uniref:Anaerobic ribonucleoside-triphosphate reductase activating protein n=1 Tax=Geoalkalibacter halelectricus TaxID=2847045 RepID=A0ABY5ZSA9_9BACT|nr:anaerobic ribonucleoside-triphosphate reductase activating protein [Geoalkalibacter halelectricus]MDO3377489.1 anaerobic ribonucleoside-triphosphate reductase activating protein [Geoalkalibacter halelectricus]UWZ80750.1 anaerobic ribonucleoside-triphosphate reductase activating protein [Geoalkalibacter halelectricus]